MNEEKTLIERLQDEELYVDAVDEAIQELEDKARQDKKIRALEKIIGLKEKQLRELEGKA